MNFIQAGRFLRFLTIPDIQQETGSFLVRYANLFKVAILIQLVSVLVLLILTSSSSLILRSSALIDTDGSTRLVLANKEAAPISQLNVVDPIPVNVISTSQHTEIDLRLGYSTRGVNCQFFTELIALVLQKELNLNTTLISFETENELFDALTEGKIDLSLCFIDPVDRIELIKPERLGHITQIGSYYWADDHKKLQIWAHAYAKTKLRSQMPCVSHFLENIKFTEATLYEKNALEWYQNHTNEVRQWLKCTP